jgi:hypothetical protein
MNEKSEDPFGMMSFVETWTKSISDLWGQTLNQTNKWTVSAAQNLQGEGGNSEQEPTEHHKGQEAMAAALKNWQNIAQAMTTPESVSSLMKGSGAMPEILMKLAHSSLNSLLEMQTITIQRLGRMGESAEAYKFSDLDENLFRLWSDIYEKEFQQFFNIPQLGLLRTYQEKANQAVDKFNLLQSQLSEFLRLLGLPFSRSFEVLQKKLAEMAEENELPEDPKAYYQMWIRILEGHYMTLFQTPEYVETMARTISSLADFTEARDATMEDFLGSLPVAKKTDMDEMARELYELKKRLRKLETIEAAASR